MTLPADLTPPTPEPYIPSGKRRCDPVTGCGQVKAEDEFYAHGNGKAGGQKWTRAICKDCDNGRPRKATPSRAIRNRARHRAMQRLAGHHPRQFDVLFQQEVEKAQREYEILQAIGAHTVPEGEPVRLRPGPKRAGQEAEHRIDVARCTVCHTNHDRGHSCPNCGHTEEEA